MPEPAHIVVAGSGLAGLACAAALGREARVTVFERLPVIGGEHWEDRAHSDLRAKAEARGVEFAAGTQAVRWEGDRLLAVGQSGGLHPARALVVATGHRPRTRAESRVDGARTGGVIPATVAAHLLAQRVILGRNVVILGAGRWAREVAVGALRAGACTVLGSPWLDFPAAAEVLPGVRVVRTLGMPRIQSIEVSDGERTWTRACDSLVLADGHVPYRNVDGAVLDRPGVIFAQDLADDEPGWSPIEAGIQAATLALQQRAPRDHVPTTLRIGHP
ncbi:hypothetical protein GCM10009555_012130 [Acrocarpospora macrocephala]|uniref:FAD/NAD(P)-binding domain-containing protein n=1 Tax=Acrocarpospora macrocephala TaxID=150177 RepID=A0A5M3WVJ5_9ACTN|nr:FAD-dependent oxidoreductase [Acrocarpospora macrocephala]GES11331.1 hypothetical protein Amac_049280 [Acrocarpospora macrocephala]